MGYDPFFYPRLPKSKYVEVAGFVRNDQIANWFRHASTLVTASKMEGFGIPPLEAMACETPVLVSNQGALPETTGGWSRWPTTQAGHFQNFTCHNNDNFSRY